MVGFIFHFILLSLLIGCVPLLFHLYVSIGWFQLVDSFSFYCDLVEVLFRLVILFWLDLARFLFWLVILFLLDLVGFLFWLVIFFLLDLVGFLFILFLLDLPGFGWVPHLDPLSVQIWLGSPFSFSFCWDFVLSDSPFGFSFCWDFVLDNSISVTSFHPFLICFAGLRWYSNVSNLLFMQFLDISVCHKQLVYPLILCYHKQFFL